jgi:hypothetical protein
MGAFGLLLGFMGPFVFGDVAPASDLTIGAKDWSLIKRESGPTNYYGVVSEGGATFLRASYAPPMKTAVMGWQVPESDRRNLKKIRWSWRALSLPNGGDECVSDKADSAAVVYVTWKSGLRYKTLKFVWSAAGKPGAICDSKRNPFVAQDTVVLESGGPLGVWKNEEVDLAAAYRRHFEGGNPNAEVPDLIGIGVMSDGDQTQSKSAADYGAFTLTRSGAPVPKS